MLKISGWALVTILLIEVLVQGFLQMPAGNEKPNALQQYFDYGRSIEEKIKRMVGLEDADAHPLLKTGWFKDIRSTAEQTGAAAPRGRVFVYGMSFSNRIAEEFALLRGDSFEIQTFAGPAAPLNHSYAYVERHRPYSPGDIVVVGILASSLSKINTLTHMTSNFEQPGAHFYPRWRITESGKLVKDEINVTSLSYLRNFLGDDSQWRRIKSELKKHDSFYNSLIFEKDVFDQSVFARLLKRAWAQRALLRARNRYHDDQGFKNAERTIEVSRALVANFARAVRADGATPFVILFNDRGYADHLYRALAPTLDADAIPYFSTHERFPARNLSNFVADGHFRPEIDREIAQAILLNLKIE